MNTEGTVYNIYANKNPELFEINNIFRSKFKKYDKRFELYKIVRKWKLVFYNDISVDVKSKVLKRISAFRSNLEKYLESKINYHRMQGLDFSHIAETKITFTTSLDFMTYKH